VDGAVCLRLAHDERDLGFAAIAGQNLAPDR
jgi:hypothetical protein